GHNCVFLGFPVGSPYYSFYHPPLHQFLDSCDVRFDEAVSYYTQYPCQGFPVPPPPLFFAPSLPPTPAPPVPPPSLDHAPSAGGAATGGTWSGGACSRGAGVGGAGVGGASSRGAGAGGSGIGSASSGGTGAGGAGTGGAGTGGASSGGAGASSGGAGARGTGTGGASFGGAGAGGAGTEETGAGGSPTTSPTARPHRHETCFQALRWLEREEQESQELHGLRALVFLPLLLSTPSHLLRTVLRFLLRTRLRLFSLLLSPGRLILLSCTTGPVVVLRMLGPRLLLPTSTPSCFVLLLVVLRLCLFSPHLLSRLSLFPHPITDYYRAAHPVVSRVLASLVTDPRASPSFVSALTAVVVDFASTRRLDYATCVVAAPPPRPLSVRGTYIDVVPPPMANAVDGMWLFKVKLPPGSPPVFKARYVARGFRQRDVVDFFHTFTPTPKMTTLRVLLHVAAQRDYELHSLDFSTAFLQGRLHEEIWLRRPPGFTDTFPPGTQWSLRWPVYGLCQLPREWHDTFHSTLRDLGFRPSCADLSLFVCTGSTPFFILVYVEDLVFATADTSALAEVKSKLHKRHKCTDLGERQRYLGLHITRDRATRTITLTQSHIVQQRSTQGYCFSLGAGAVLWRSTRSSSVASSSAEAKIYASAMAAQELRWLTFLLADLSERPCSALILYANNKVMILLCREPRLESRVKHIDVRYFLLRELQRRGQARLDFVASEANIADVFTKALAPGDHHRFSVQLGLIEVGPQLL
ncbi:unnamed protein product, partial [Closterium sp. NIES-53]